MPLPAPFVFGVFTDACLLSFTEEPLFEDLFRPSTLLLLPLVTPVQQQQPPKAPPVFLADLPEDFGDGPVRCGPFVSSGRFGLLVPPAERLPLLFSFFVPPPNNPPILSLPNFSAIPENIF